MSKDVEIADEELDLISTTENEKIRIKNLQNSFIENKIKVQINQYTFVYMTQEEFNEHKSREESEASRVMPTV